MGLTLVRHPQGVFPGASSLARRQPSAIPDAARLSHGVRGGRVAILPGLDGRPVRRPAPSTDVDTTPRVGRSHKELGKTPVLFL